MAPSLGGEPLQLCRSVLERRGEVVTPEEADEEVTTVVPYQRPEVLRCLLQGYEVNDVSIHVSQIEEDVCEYVCHKDD